MRNEREDITTDINMTIKEYYKQLKPFNNLDEIYSDPFEDINYQC